MVELLAALWVGVGVYALMRYPHVFREAVFRYPVLVLESDDWGPGPPEDGDRLRELASCAGSHRDARSRPAAVTLGIVLAVPQTPIEDEDEYRRLTLASDRCSQVRIAIREGVEQGVFFTHLHGGEHCWPPALLAVARRDESVRQWLSAEGMPRTEKLPSFLQSRWIDASTLPSTPLQDGLIDAAVEDEVRLFSSILGERPSVVVPPTFVWDERVERAWAKRGIRVVITPGCRYEGRDESGNLQPSTKRIRNGDRVGDSQVTYLVRDVYFEPSLGHRAEEVLEHVLDRARTGRPVLIEMHRFNFVDNVEKAHSAFLELHRLLDLALLALPDLRFAAAAEVAESIVREDPRFVETRFVGKLSVWCRRLWDERRMRWLAIATAAIVPGALVWFATSTIAGNQRRGLWR